MLNERNNHYLFMRVKSFVIVNWKVLQNSIVYKLIKHFTD